MRILIVKLSSLGDVVHAMPAVQDLRVWHPEARIDWVVEPGFAPLVQRMEGVGEVLRAPIRRWRKAWWSADVRREALALRDRLQSSPYDAVYDLQGLTKSAVIARLAGVTADGHRYGLGNATEGSSWERPARWLVDRPIRLEPHVHAMDRARRLVARAAQRDVIGLPRYGLRAHPNSELRAQHGAPPQVVFVHGTSREDKLWPQSSWIALGKRLLADGWRIALPQSSETEQTRAELIAAALQFERAPQVEVWPSLPLGDVIDRMATAQAVIGVDSGLSHIAVALALPHVQLYNVPTAWRTGPQVAHGHAHQVSVQGSEHGRAVPGIDAVWSAWETVRPVAPALQNL